MARCKYCGKDTESGSEFIVEGKYPKARSVWFWSAIDNWSPPEKYGEIYHKECYLK